MWDRLLVDCNVATLEEKPGNPLGLIENGAVTLKGENGARIFRRGRAPVDVKTGAEISGLVGGPNGN